jgi:hypothetical protein
MSPVFSEEKMMHRMAKNNRGKSEKQAYMVVNRGRLEFQSWKRTTQLNPFHFSIVGTKRNIGKQLTKRKSSIEMFSIYYYYQSG